MFDENLGPGRRSGLRFIGDTPAMDAEFKKIIEDRRRGIDTGDIEERLKQAE